MSLFLRFFVLILFVSVHIDINVIIINIMLFISMLSSRWFSFSFCYWSCHYFKYLGYQCIFAFYYVNICIMVFNLHYLLFTNLFCLLKFTENSKKRKSGQNQFVVLLRILVRNKAIFRVYVFVQCIC